MVPVVVGTSPHVLARANGEHLFPTPCLNDAVSVAWN